MTGAPSVHHVHCGRVDCAERLADAVAAQEGVVFRLRHRAAQQVLEEGARGRPVAQHLVGDDDRAGDFLGFERDRAQVDVGLGLIATFLDPLNLHTAEDVAGRGAGLVERGNGQRGVGRRAGRNDVRAGTHQRVLRLDAHDLLPELCRHEKPAPGLVLVHAQFGADLGAVHALGADALDEVQALIVRVEADRGHELAQALELAATMRPLRYGDAATTRHSRRHRIASRLGRLYPGEARDAHVERCERHVVRVVGRGFLRGEVAVLALGRIDHAAHGRDEGVALCAKRRKADEPLLSHDQVAHAAREDHAAWDASQRARRRAGSGHAPWLPAPRAGDRQRQDRARRHDDRLDGAPLPPSHVAAHPRPAHRRIAQAPGSTACCATGGARMRPRGACPSSSTPTCATRLGSTRYDRARPFQT